MLKQTTSVRRTAPHIVSGEWISAENNAHGTTVNFVPEMIFADEEKYRGCFHVTDNGNCTVSVYDTTLYDPSGESRPGSSGAVFLHWQEITPEDESGKQFAIFHKKIFTIPALEAYPVTRSGWLVLKMRKLKQSNSSTFTFSDKYLGQVKLDFSWIWLDDITQAPSDCDYMFTAYIKYLAEFDFIEIFQQQHGPGVMYLPIDAVNANPDDYSSSFTPEDSSSSESSGSYQEPSTSETPEEPEVPDNPDDPENSTSSESSKSTTPEDPDNPDNPDDPEDNSSSSTDQPEESGSSSSSSSSSSSTTAGTTLIHVTVSYITNSITRGGENDIYGFSEVQLTGSFEASDEYPPNGYEFTLTGMEKYDNGMGEGTYQLEHTHSMRVFRNIETNCWDYYDSQAIEWGVYYEYYDASYDVLSTTPVYEHPSLEEYPDQPGGRILVCHEITRGTLNPPPMYQFTSSFTVTFTPEPPQIDKDDNNKENQE